MNLRNGPDAMKSCVDYAQLLKTPCLALKPRLRKRRQAHSGHARNRPRRQRRAALCRVELSRRSEQCHHPNRGTVAPCFPMYASTYDWGNIDKHKFDDGQLGSMKKTCQQHCFSTLNHNLAYCYNHARVIKFVWTNLVKNRMKGGARSFED